MRTSKQRWIAGGLLALIGLAAAWAYAPALHAPFVYDDLFFIVRNDAIKEPTRLIEFLTNADTASEGKRWGTIFRPLRTVTYALDYGAWRLNPLGYHLTSLFLHLAAIAGVFALAWRWTGHVAGALLGTAVFALHPLPAEAALFIGARSDVMAVIPVLALAILVLAPGPRTPRRTAGELALLLVALACKEATAAVVPALGLALWLREPSREGFKRAVRWGIPGTVLVGCYGVLRTLALGHGSRYDYLAGGDPWLTWGSALRARVFELGQVVQPDYLSPSYLAVPVMTTWADLAFWLALTATAACAWVAWRCRLVAPAVTAGIGWWVLFLLPTSQLIPLNMLMGNRWLYAPFIGLACIIAAGVAAADRRWGAAGRRVLLVAGAAWLLHCGLQTHARAELWADPVALWEDANESWPEDRSVYLSLAGLHRRDADRLADLDPAAAEAARVRGTDAVLRLAERSESSALLANAASTLLGGKREVVARRILEHAYASVPDSKTRALEVDLWLAAARWATGDRKGAVEIYDALVDPAQPRSASVDRVRRGEIFYSFRSRDAASGERTRALVWLQRARREFMDGRVDQADKSVRAAKELWPECQMAVWGRATTLRMANRPGLAGKEIDTVWPNIDVQPLFVLRAELAELAGYPGAAGATRMEAIRRWPFVPELWDDLANHYRRQGEFGIARACIARREDLAK